ncbi:hypothetical protein [Salinimicrobium terrae]|uniref:hypothetical protein n=1 Tax=Salinimicrobium terrae TaxID=470866 RepID=UPI000401354F|nr:hypothetical protein [Salinimicrobium terrae]
MFILPLLSCSIETDGPLDPGMPGDWVLVQTSGQVKNSVQTGSDMPFQEAYTLNADGTFTKTRIHDGEVLKATGTYEISETSNEMQSPEVNVYVYFHHDKQSMLVATCYSSSLTEHLYLTTDV